MISPERRATLKKNPVVRLTGWQVTEDNKLYITDFDVLENLLEFPVLGSPRQLPFIDLEPYKGLKVQVGEEKPKHFESEKQLAENIAKQKWEKKILQEAFILKQARSRAERRKVKTFLLHVNLEITCNSFQVPRIAEPEKPPIPFYLDHLNLDKSEKHLANSKEEQLLRSDEHGSKIS